MRSVIARRAARGISITVVICSACGTENRDGRRFCSQCGAALELACPACGASNEAGDRFCGACGTTLADGGAGTARPGALAANDGSERRLVSVLFADLVGFTPLAERRDPEEVRELLSRYFEQCQSLIGRYGGTVGKFIGDAVMAVWGAPAAHEDDPERAVRAALDLCVAVSALGAEIGVPGLQVRVGVLTGNAALAASRGDDRGARRHEDDAIAALRALGARPLLSRALAERAQRRDDPEARAEARAIYHELGRAAGSRGSTRLRQCPC